MIHSFHEPKLAKLFEAGKAPAGIPSNIVNSLLKRLNELHTASNEQELTNNSLRYERLGMARDELSSIRVNSNYRLIFAWDIGAHKVRLTAHDYKSMLL